LVAWHKKPGEAVARDENLVDLETDKVVLEVPAPAAGVLREIRVTDGTTVTAGEVLALLDEGDGRAGEASAEAPSAADDAADQPAAGDGGAQARQTGAAAERSAAVHKLSPAVRRLLEEHDLDAT